MDNPRPRRPRMPTAAKLAELKLSREVAWYLLDRGYGLPRPDQVPIYSTPDPSGVPGAVFDGDAVDRVLRVMSLLKHTKGDYAGRPLVPDCWQIAYIFAPVFGWKAPRKSDGKLLRIVREAWVEVSRKAGKSTILGGIGIYMTTADGEQGAECVAAATNERQAGYVFQPVRALVQGSPLLAQYAKAYQKKIIHHPTMSEFSVVSSAAEGQHGANLHFYCVDEVHVHRSADLIEAIETGTGSRSQPLGVLITTADEGRPDTVYVRKRNRIVALAEGTLADPTTYGVIWAAALSEEDLKVRGVDPFSEDAQRRANPGYGVSPTAEYLERQALIAKQSPADYSKYLRLHLGIRTKQATVYIKVDQWDLNAGKFDRTLMVGQRCFGGLDLASTADFTALCWLFPRDDGRFRALWRFWLPESGYERLVRRTSRQIEEWRRQGLVKVTDGDVVDDEVIENDILRDCATYNVAELGYDPWNASAITNTLSKNGVKLMQVRQGYGSLSSPLKEIKRRLYLTRPGEPPQIEHNGNPIMRWMVGNLAVAEDEAGNVKPDRLRSADKIDGCAALTTAMARCLAAAPARRSAYEDSGLTVAR